MPRTWSNRKIEHVELNAPKGGLPTAGWAIMGFGLVMLTIYTALAVNICMHPVQTPIDETSPSSAPITAAR